MSSFDSIYKKIASSLEQGGPGQIPEVRPEAPQIAPSVAHELNNILTIIQGYADRLVLKHQKDQTLEPPLKLISEAARRASMIVRNAREATNGAATRQSQPKVPEPAEPVA